MFVIRERLYAHPVYQYFPKSMLEQICSVPNRNTLQVTLQIFKKLPVSRNTI